MVPKNQIADPAARFVTDFTRLITDVDRLMVDLRSVSDKENGFTNGNGVAKTPTLTGTISRLQDHARTFAKSIRHFGNHLDRVPVPYLEFDRNGTILGTNQDCAEMLNGSSTPLIGKSLFSFVAGADLKRLREQLVTVRQTNKPQAVRLTLVHKRKQFPVRLQIRPQSVGKQAGYAAMIETAAPALDGHSATGRIVEDGALSLHDLVLSLSHEQTLKSVGDAVVNYCSKAFDSPLVLVFVAYSERLRVVSERHAKPIPKTILTEEWIQSGPVAKVFRTGEPAFWRLERTAQSSVHRQLCRLLPRSQCRNVNFLPIQAPGQQAVGVLAIFLREEDECPPAVRNELRQIAEVISGSVTRACAYEAALAECARAENAVRRKDEFLSVLSHELKNPMMPILGWAVALSSGTLPADKQNFALDGIVRNVRTLNYLIEDLFDAARISSGKLRLQPEEIRIQEVAREALTAVQQTAEAKKLRVSTDISEAIAPFFADPRRLRQVLMNLLTNAVKFTPGGGSISLKIFRRGESVECVVSDTGKGIESKFLPLVFDRFTQENRPLKLGTGGLGLGLAIVREIVELHGGSIRAFSDGIDKGSTFIVRLPMRRRQTSALRTNARPRWREGGVPTIRVR